MQNAKLADALLLASKAEIHRRGVAVEEGILVELLDPVAIGFDGSVLAVSDEVGAEHEQQAVQQTVDNLESAGLSTPGGSEVALVTGPPLGLHVLEDNIGGLEDLDGQAVALVLADSLDQTGQERGADDLILQRLGVGEPDDSVAVILAVEPCKVLVVTAESQGHDLAPSGHGSLDAHNVAELVDGERGGNGGAAVGGAARQPVEAVADGDILHDIGLVQDIGTSWGDGDLQQVGVLV